MTGIKEILGMKKKKRGEKFDPLDDLEEVQYQNIIIKFTNGKEVNASVPVFSPSEEETKELEIESIFITEPRSLPAGCSFSKD